MEDINEITDAKLEARAAELIAVMDKWNITVNEAKRVLWEAERELENRSYKILLKDLKK